MPDSLVDRGKPNMELQTLAGVVGERIFKLHQKFKTPPNVHSGVCLSRIGIPAEVGQHREGDQLIRDF